jgi:hypothetical protein
VEVNRREPKVAVWGPALCVDSVSELRSDGQAGGLSHQERTRRCAWDAAWRRMPGCGGKIRATILRRSMEQRPRTVPMVAAFLFAATAIAAVAGVSLLWPNALLDRLWELNKPGAAAFRAFGGRSLAQRCCCSAPGRWPPETQGQATRVRIRTAKPGLHSGRNWSAPIYRALRKQLGSPGA